jgi:hypothetical protein
MKTYVRPREPVDLKKVEGGDFQTHEEGDRWKTASDEYQGWLLQSEYRRKGKRPKQREWRPNQETIKFSLGDSVSGFYRRGNSKA